MKLSGIVGLLLLALVSQAQATTTLCIEIYPSSYDPGPTANSATRVDVAATGLKQGYTLYRYGPGTGGEGDPADQRAFFHFQYPNGYDGGTFVAHVDVSGHGETEIKQGCYQMGLVANTAGSIYSNINTLTEGPGTLAQFLPTSPAFNTYVVTFPATTAISKQTLTPCTSATCSGTTVVGSLWRITSSCGNNDPDNEDVLDIHMCYTVP